MPTSAASRPATRQTGAASARMSLSISASRITLGPACAGGARPAAATGRRERDGAQRRARPREMPATATGAAAAASTHWRSCAATSPGADWRVSRSRPARLPPDATSGGAAGFGRKRFGRRRLGVDVAPPRRARRLRYPSRQARPVPERRRPALRAEARRVPARRPAAARPRCLRSRRLRIRPGVAGCGRPNRGGPAPAIAEPRVPRLLLSRVPARRR